MKQITKVNGKTSEFEIKLNSKIYKKELVEQAITDFSDFFDAKFKGEFIQLTLKDISDKNSDLIPYEFCNYVFALVKNNGE